VLLRSIFIGQGNHWFSPSIAQSICPMTNWKKELDYAAE